MYVCNILRRRKRRDQYRHAYVCSSSSMYMLTRMMTRSVPITLHIPWARGVITVGLQCSSSDYLNHTLLTYNCGLHFGFTLIGSTYYVCSTHTWRDKPLRSLGHPCYVGGGLTTSPPATISQLLMFRLSSLIYPSYLRGKGNDISGPCLCVPT